MTLTLTPLFQSAHKALLFAYTHAENQRGIAAAAERTIATFARGRYPDPPRPPSRGLGGLDGAAQAGLIKSTVGQMKPVYLQRSIEAQFAVLSPDTQRRAMFELALRVRHAVPSGLDALLVELVQLHYRRHKKVWQVVEASALGERVTRRHWSVVRKALTEIDDRAMATIEGVLESKGVVSPPT